MVLSLLKSASETFTERIRSPFGGTLIAVIVLLNWKLFLSIIFFDDSYNFDNRIDFIENYIKQNHPWKLILHPIWITFVSLIGFLFLSYSAMAINLWFVKWAKPWIVSKIDRNSIASKEDLDYYRNLLRQRGDEVIELEKRYLEEKAARKDADSERLNIQSSINQLHLENNELKNRPFGLWNETKLHRIFDGKWLNVYQNLYDDSSGKEFFEVNSDERYLSENDRHPITIENIYTDRNHEYLYFEKNVQVQSRRKKLLNYLKKTRNNSYEGVELQIEGGDFSIVKIAYSSVLEAEKLDGSIQLN